MGETLVSKIFADRWRIATKVFPALLITLFGAKGVLPLAQYLHGISDQGSVLRENTYESAWLDSTKKALGTEVEILRAFQSTRELALNSDSNIQTTIDRIRGLAQAAGVEVTKTTPILSRAEPLTMLKVKIEGFTQYSGLMHFFATLQVGHSDLFLEEMMIRQGGERANGRLESQLILNVYSRKQGGLL